MLLLGTLSTGGVAASLPKLKLKDLEGHRASLGKYQGKIIVLNFWATWCEPCQEEMPMLVREESSFRNRSVVVIGVSLAVCWKTRWLVVIPSGARNLALQIKSLRDSSSPAAPRNDRLNEFFNKLLDKPGDEEKVRAFAAKYHVTFPIWVGGTADDLDRWKMGPAVPATAFIDRSGKITGRVMGEMRKPSLEHRLE